MPFHSSEQRNIIMAFTAWSASLHLIFSLVFDVVSDDGGAVSRGVREEIAKPQWETLQDWRSHIVM